MIKINKSLLTKKIIVPVLIIGTLLTGAGFGTYAWFTSQKVSGNNTISSGKLAVELGGQAAADKTFTFGSVIEPGETATIRYASDGTSMQGPASIDVKNTGNFNMAAISGFEIGALDSAGNLVVGDGSSKLSEGLYFYNLKTEFLNSNGDVIDGMTTDIVQNGKVGNSAFNDLAVNGRITLSKWIAAANSISGLPGGKFIVGIVPKNTFRITFELKLDENVDDTFQNLTFTGRYKAIATQMKVDAVNKLISDNQINVTPYDNITFLEENITKQGGVVK